MYKYIFSVTCFFLCFISISISQVKENVYFISGQTRDICSLAEEGRNVSATYNEYYCKPNPLVLLHLTSDSLRIIDTLNHNKKKNGYFTKIRHFEEEGWFYLMERDADYTTSRFDKFEEIRDHVAILKYYYNDTFYLNRINFDSLFSPGNLSKPHRSYCINKQIYTTSAVYKSSGVPFRIIVNKNLDTLHILNKIDTINLYAKYESGFQDHFLFTGFSYGADGKFRTRKDHNDSDEWKSYNFYVPYSKEDGKGVREFNICYHTSCSRYLLGFKEKFKNLDSIVLMYIHDKKLDKWDSIKMHRYYTKFNVYKDEFAFGTGIKQYLENDTNEDQRKSLTANMHKYNSNFGCTPDLRKAMGRFFILHIPTKTFDEMIFEERDVELLEIKNKIIYYRKYDEIRTVKIGKNHKIDRKSDSLLIKNNQFVPFIHRIFFSKADKFVIKK